MKREREKTFSEDTFSKEAEDYLTFVTKSFPFGVFIHAEHGMVRFIMKSKRSSKL